MTNNTKNVQPIQSSPARDVLREKLMSKQSRRRVPATLNGGIEVELLQPSLGTVLDNQMDYEKNSERSASLLIRSAVVPGTDEFIFTEADLPEILTWGWSNEMLEVQNLILEMSGVDIATAEEELKDNPLEEGSSS